VEFLVASLPFMLGVCLVLADGNVNFDLESDVRCCLSVCREQR
jgi:hypothetical protein